MAHPELLAALTSATYEVANRPLTFDGFSIDHDYNGNLTSLDGDTFVWNVRDQLVGIVGTGLSATFGYDGLGRRSKKTLNGQTTEYLSDGINPLQEQAVAGQNWTALTMTGLGVDEVIARGDPSGVYYYLPDGLGSTVALTDGTGAVHTEYTYAPFGETTRTGTVATNPFQFTGRENDNTGLYYYRARYYHPILQRFISEDPIGFGGGDINLYVYALNNPVSLIDPLGLIPWLVFNGYWVTYYNDAGEAVYSAPATSGILGVTNPNVPGGPIPEGEYTLDPLEISEASLLRNWLGDWGRYRVPLHPNLDTKTFGRGGFFLHGGRRPGSAGCVDINDADEKLFPMLMEQTDPIPFIVRY